MTEAARKTGRVLRRDFGEVEQLQVSHKGPSDFVTAADIKAEKTLRAELQKARPRFGFLMEESGEIQGEDGKHRWIIDPIDGTTNFLHGIPHFAISIGLEMEGEMIAGLVYNPIVEEVFWAEKGQGAFLNDKRLRVSARNRMSEAVMATGIPFHGRPGHEPFIDQMGRVMKDVAGIRRMGAASLDLAYVAAGVLLVREAGGFVTDFKGDKNVLASGNVVAANAKLHKQFLDLVVKG